MNLLCVIVQIFLRSFLTVCHRIFDLRGRGSSASAALAAGSAAAPVSARRRSAAPPGSARPATCRLCGGRWLPASPPAGVARCIQRIPSLPPVKELVSDNLTTETTPRNIQHATPVPHSDESVAGVLCTAQATLDTRKLVQVHVDTRKNIVKHSQMSCMHYRAYLHNKNKYG